ncbi:MAG TPA: hypothetical protein VNV44_05640 [Solirubrobacteraceae bacterium]|jgi:hypothetical protein|nr:hypothetical protein [Solirubrobacteraceae bacterium]
MSQTSPQSHEVILPGLERLLVTVAQKRIEAETVSAEPTRAFALQRSRLRRRPGGRRSPVFVALLVLGGLLVAAGGAAAVLLVSEGSPLPAPHAADVAPWEHPVAGSVRLAGLDAPDPEGGAPWDMRIFKSSTGETCTAVGQVFNGKFGIVGLDHVFRELPLTGVDACGVPGIAGPVLAGARQFAGRTAAEERTVVNGIAGKGAKSVVALGLGEERRLTLGPQGSFVTVFQGLLGEVRPRIVVVDAKGRSRSISFAASAAFETADPDGGAPWEASGGSAIGVPGSTGDENCASAAQEVGPGSSGGPVNEAEAPGVCGRLGNAPLFVRFHRFNPGDGENTGNPWGNNPARTLVYGAVSLRVRRLTLTGAGAPRPIAIDPHGGAFIAVLDGQVNPHALTLVATLTDGRRLRYRRSTALIAELTGKPVTEGPVEPYRRIVHRGFFAPLEDPIQRTVHEQLHAADPAGGPDWSLRSWQGRADPRAKFGEANHPKSFYCWQAGVVNAGRLVEPVPGAAAIPLNVSVASPGEPGTQCMGAGTADSENLTPRISSYPRNAGEYEPLPVRTVISGVIEPPATAPMLLGAGGPRPITTTDANHAYLIVLPGTYWAGPLRVSVRLPDGRTVVSGVESDQPDLQPQVRAPSPDGSASWGFTDTSLCPTAWFLSEIGRVIDDRFARVAGDTGEVAPGPEGTTTGSRCGTRNARAQERYEPLGGEQSGNPNHPVGFTAVPLAPEGTHEPTQAEIERRTLPGSTVIAGRSAADVTSITLSTPADVRTVEPTGPTHVFIVVYDGVFYRGTFTATVLLKNGRTVTQQIPGGLYNRYAAPGLRPFSLGSRLRSDERTLRGLAAQVAAVLHAKPGQRAKLLNGVPLGQLLKGLRSIRQTVSSERQRIAYIHDHPGVLPAE